MNLALLVLASLTPLLTLTTALAKLPVQDHTREITEGVDLTILKEFDVTALDEAQGARQFEAAMREMPQLFLQSPLEDDARDATDRQKVALERVRANQYLTITFAYCFERLSWDKTGREASCLTTSFHRSSIDPLQTLITFSAKLIPISDNGHKFSQEFGSFTHLPDFRNSWRHNHSRSIPAEDSNDPGGLGSRGYEMRLAIGNNYLRAFDGEKIAKSISPSFEQDLYRLVVGSDGGTLRSWFRSAGYSVNRATFDLSQRYAPLVNWTPAEVAENTAYQAIKAVEFLKAKNAEGQSYHYYCEGAPGDKRSKLINGPAHTDAVTWECDPREMHDFVDSMSNTGFVFNVETKSWTEKARTN